MPTTLLLTSYQNFQNFLDPTAPLNLTKQPFKWPIVPYFQGENVRDKMKELALGMSARSRTNELSFALVTFAVVIFLGIIGLGVVVTHRQKRKRQLKDLLRAKNLGPILESREIAQNTGKFLHSKNFLDCASPAGRSSLKRCSFSLLSWCCSHSTTKTKTTTKGPAQGQK